MSLRLAASLGAVQTVVSMVLGFFSVKVTAVYLGPAGLGTLGQLNYFMALTQGALSAGLHTGLVKRTAELGDDLETRRKVISTVLRLIVCVGVPTAILIAIAHEVLARELLHDVGLSSALLVFAAASVFGLIGTGISACASGAKDYRSVATVNICAAVVSFAMTVALCPIFGVLGGLMALALLPAITLVINWAVARSRPWWPKKPFSHGFAPKEAKAALAFVPMAVVNTVGAPLLQLLLRDQVAAHDGMAAVGLLQGVIRLSEMYLGIAGSVFVMYYFPRFSEIKESKELLHELKKGLLVIAPSVAFASLSIYLLRDQIVHIVFTKDFLGMRELFGWQMIGNTLKMTGSLFAYMLLAKIHAFRMAILDATTMLVWWALSIYFIAAHGAVGATEAYAATYAIYAMVTPIGAYLFIRKLRAKAVRAI